MRVSDLERSAEFYVNACGLSRLHEIAASTFDGVIVGREDGVGGGLELVREREGFETIDIGTGFVKTVLTVDDVDLATERAGAAGAVVVMEPQSLAQMGGLRLSMVRDLDGYVVEFVQRP
ncbi:VOC family protein [Rhodococcus sp. IEGM1428]|uniref:VOC family protein n=1 Tax=Rhodococcus sp. IEGM1428 TaxID=3392191 RepID=UPI003D0D3BFB